MESGQAAAQKPTPPHSTMATRGLQRFPGAVPFALFLPMEPHAEDRHRAAVGVEGRIADKLVVQREVGRLPDGETIISLQHVFAAGVKLPSPFSMPVPPALRNAICSAEAPLKMPAMPMTSSGRFQFSPLILRPSDMRRRWGRPRCRTSGSGRNLARPGRRRAFRRPAKAVYR